MCISSEWNSIWKANKGRTGNLYLRDNAETKLAEAENSRRKAIRGESCERRPELGI